MDGSAIQSPTNRIRRLRCNWNDAADRGQAQLVTSRIRSDEFGSARRHRPQKDTSKFCNFAKRTDEKSNDANEAGCRYGHATDLCRAQADCARLNMERGFAPVKASDIKKSPAKAGLAKLIEIATFSGVRRVLRARHLHVARYLHVARHLPGVRYLHVARLPHG